MILPAIALRVRYGVPPMKLLLSQGPPLAPRANGVGCTPLQTSARRPPGTAQRPPDSESAFGRQQWRKKHDTYMRDKNCNSSLDLRLRDVVLLRLV
ncbi:hypothetical protein DXU04_10425 [Bradyrhizobium diazoefficiens]